MKIALLFALSASSQAFCPSAWGTVRPSTSLYNARVDSSEAIKAAVAASKTYGAGSPEARVAWDIVEEMDASDNSASYKGGVTDQNCFFETDECKEYEEKMEKLSDIIKEFGPKMENVKTLASEIQAIKMPYKGPLPGSDSPELRQAMANAKSVQEDKGKDSPEAKVAWEEVEEIASANNEAALGGMLDDECLVEAIDACEALEELNRVVQLDRETSRYSG